MAASNLTAERLRELFHYCPDTGVFTRKACRIKSKVGSVAGSLSNVGYLVFSVDGFRYTAHRLAWLYVYGEWPRLVDHINRSKIDNRIANLRDADMTMNVQNRSEPNRQNKSGVLGVCWDRGRWVAHIMVNRKRKNLGRYHTVDEAGAAYLTAKRQLHAGCTI